jgi:hypothetical protein
MQYSDEELIEYLKELYTELGRTPRKRDLKNIVKALIENILAALIML